MDQDRWTEVDRYINGLLVPADPALEATLADSQTAGLPAIQVPPNLGKLLHLMARIQRSRTVLEIGTLGGYSTIWLARALPSDGRLVTLEADPRHAEVAGRNIRRAGLSDRVEIRVGRAIDTLPQLAAEGRGPFDFVFIDADKQSNPEYFAWALRLSRVGTLIVVDNVVRNGAVSDGASRDSAVAAVRRMNQMIAAEPRVTATAVQTVGAKGYDGFLMALVTAA